MAKQSNFLVSWHPRHQRMPFLVVVALWRPLRPPPADLLGVWTFSWAAFLGVAFALAPAPPFLRGRGS
eukprot:13630569-Alexandrium_andersonii.AAC.1